MTIAAATTADAGRRAHIVDVLIEERAPTLSASPGWPLLRPALYNLLHYRKARRMADHIAPLPGRAALDHVSAELSLKVEALGLERLPDAGRIVLIANHPTGIADGVALFDAVKARRQDICFYANADAHRVCGGLGEVLIPVEWVEAKRTRERTRLTLQMTREAMEAERALAIFPAGRLARRAPDGTLADPPWMTTALSVARKYDAQVVPVHVAGPWSTLFHLFNRLSAELRDITLFHELLNKQGRRFSLIFGPPIPPGVLDPDAGKATLELKRYVERVLPNEPDRPFA
ncbi:MAG: 1-acyl-sn-glycerol-3-phosphate acyltransferase [Phenylobacterium sp.]|uniref:GNAT family N-acetyltransferase n=1 Tax=Phenylobacterium sp. TaxID=1871053 RepID=UPI003564B4BE